MAPSVPPSEMETGSSCDESHTADRDPVLAKNRQEYLALVLSFAFIIIESFLRVVTIALPAPIIDFCYNGSRAIFNRMSEQRYTTVQSSKKERSIVARVRDADGFVDLCEIWNDGSYTIEEHVVQTGDGYLLGLHRVVKKSDTQINRKGRRRRGGERTVRGNGGKKVVYLHHGLLMNSEVWVCLLDKKQCLPFVLAELGFDVWLGNNRGNKYSKKSIYHRSTSAAFWDFSLDSFALFDIPDSINYILESTDQSSLSYIGFSQGTAQAFATLSIHPKLNEKVDVFIALAPAMSPAGLSNSVVDALMKASPNLIYLFFGRKSILPSTTFWQSILYPPIFVRVIDFCLVSLFNWTGRNIPLKQKLAAYAHLYSYTSVKSVVHWFQIIRNKSFQMYDDDVQTGFTSVFSNRSFYKAAKFPTRNIIAPIVLVYGGSDSLVDINIMLKELPPHTVAKGISHYEHLDMLWGRDVDKVVFPHVLEALGKYSTTPEPESSTHTPQQIEQTKVTENTDLDWRQAIKVRQMVEPVTGSLSNDSEDDASAEMETSYERQPDTLQSIIPPIAELRAGFELESAFEPNGHESLLASRRTKLQTDLAPDDGAPLLAVAESLRPATPPSALAEVSDASRDHTPDRTTSPCVVFETSSSLVATTAPGDLHHERSRQTSTGSVNSLSAGVGRIGVSGIALGQAKPVSGVSTGTSPVLLTSPPTGSRNQETSKSNGVDDRLGSPEPRDRALNPRKNRRRVNESDDA